MINLTTIAIIVTAFVFSASKFSPHHALDVLLLSLSLSLSLSKERERERERESITARFVILGRAVPARLFERD